MKQLQLNILVQLYFLFCYFLDGTLQKKCNKQCTKNVPFYKDDSLILKTLNGKIRGSCNKVEINDPSNPNLSNYIISWKSIK